MIRARFRRNLAERFDDPTIRRRPARYLIHTFELPSDFAHQYSVSRDNRNIRRIAKRPPLHLPQSSGTLHRPRQKRESKRAKSHNAELFGAEGTVESDCGGEQEADGSLHREE